MKELPAAATQQPHHHPTKVLLFHTPSSLPPPSPCSSSSSNHHLRLVLTLLSFFTLASLLTLLSTSTTTIPIITTTTTSPRQQPAPPFTVIPTAIFDALVHYAVHSNDTHMSHEELLSVAAAVRRRSPCNLLVFGLTPDSLLLRSLNHGGRSVFLDENEYHISFVERRHPSVPLEAYDVSFITRVRDLPHLIRNSRELRGTDCRPVQNLLYSDCKLAINDLPNELYEVDWDVIVVDGPRGYDADFPGRAGAIFTAGVLARTAGNGGDNNSKGRGRRERAVDVFVHEHGREVERVSSEEFLCAENMVKKTSQLAHFVIIDSNKDATGGGGGGGDGGGGEELDFCRGRKRE